MVSYLSFSQTYESFPRPYLCLPSDVVKSVRGLHVAFGFVLGFRGVRLVVPEPKPCLAVLFCNFRFKLAINAVIPPVRQHACHAENITDLEQSQMWPGGSGWGRRKRRQRRGERPITSSFYETYAL